MNLLGSLDIDFKLPVEIEPLAVETLHEYDSDAVEDRHAEIVTEESTTSTAERDTVRSGSPGRESNGTGAGRAATDRSADPQAPR